MRATKKLRAMTELQSFDDIYQMKLEQEMQEKARQS